MSVVIRYLRELVTALADGWTRFWFQPSDPTTLAAIRILTGLMLLYTHLVWSLDLMEFFGPGGWLSAEAVAEGYGTDSIEHTWAISHFWWLTKPAEIRIAHGLALVVFAMLTVGLFTRVVSVLAWLLTISYVHRMPAAMFGLDQLNVMLAMYLMIGPAGATWSVDRWWKGRGATAKEVLPSPWTTVAIRLIQVHMCIIYFFAGISKLAGRSWWDGTALWMSLANAEYQTIDGTWMSEWPRAINLMTHAALFWEVFFCVLVWPRITRPLMLAMAVVVHLGIGLWMGMLTFGVAMLIGCLAFVSPQLLRDCCINRIESPVRSKG